MNQIESVFFGLFLSDISSGAEQAGEFTVYSEKKEASMKRNVGFYAARTGWREGGGGSIGMSDEKRMTGGAYARRGQKKKNEAV